MIMPNPQDKQDEIYMRLALTAAADGVRKGQTPFGACIVRKGSLVTRVHNVVWKTQDITAHAEIHAIRQACRLLKTIDLSGCEIYSTCEPCPMCFSAIHWARIGRIVYGSSIADARKAGFNELSLSNQVMKTRGRSPVIIRRYVLRRENRELFEQWMSRPGHRAY